jgi:hypothetical protein
MRLSRPAWKRRSGALAAVSVIHPTLAAAEAPLATPYSGGLVVKPDMGRPERVATLWARRKLNGESPVERRS